MSDLRLHIAVSEQDDQGFNSNYSVSLSIS